MQLGPGLKPRLGQKRQLGRGLGPNKQLGLGLEHSL